MGCRLCFVVLVGCGRVGFDPVGGGGDDEPVIANVAFVTSTTHQPGLLGGVAGGDAICAARATEAGLRGNFVAWLSTGTTPARDRLAGARGWIRTDGRPVVDRVEDLVTPAMITPTMLHPLRIDEHGRDIGTIDDDFVATGTYADGSTNANCGDFVNASGMVMVGLPWQTGGSWTVRNVVSCASSARLYCFQIDLDVPLVIRPAGGRRAFVSTTDFDPLTGPPGADAVCATDANAAGLTGVFRALIAVPGGAASRFDDTGPSWIRIDGIPLADDARAFLNARSHLPLNLTATGVNRSVLATTGFDTTSDDPPEPTWTCNGWSGGAGAVLATGFSSSTGRRMFSDTTAPCVPRPVYCLE